MRILLTLAAVATATLFCTGAFAQSETDRLRDALRGAISQARALEDQRAALQARLADAERREAAAKDAAEKAKADIERIEKEHREAEEEFDRRLKESEQTLETTLEKWKSAYDEAATVARNENAARAKFEGEASACKAAAKSSVSRNEALVKAGRELVQRYKTVTMDNGIAAYEKMFQFTRVELQNQLQETTDKFLDQKVKP